MFHAANRTKWKRPKHCNVNWVPGYLPRLFSPSRLTARQGRQPPNKQVPSRHNHASSSVLCDRSAITMVVLSPSKFSLCNLPRRRLRSLPCGRAADVACSPSPGRRAARPRLRAKAASGATRGASLPAAPSAQPGARPALTRRPGAPPPTPSSCRAPEPAWPERVPHGRGAVTRRWALRTYRRATLTAAALQLPQPKEAAEPSRAAPRRTDGPPLWARTHRPPRAGRRRFRGRSGPCGNPPRPSHAPPCPVASLGEGVPSSPLPLPPPPARG